ncbi:AAA domain-containing protein [Cladophialophora immunda]|nr:AAA domain-containing protein [Cladophialophora immunda]
MKSAKYTLQDGIAISDSEWRYNIPSLPEPERCRQAGRIKSIQLSCSSSLQGIYLDWVPLTLNRATREHRLEDLVQVSVSDFRPVYDSRDESLPKDHSQAVDYICRFLTSGVVINGVQYSFYGHSNSQLKSRSCYLLAGSKKEVSKKVEALGDFSKIKTVAKKAKRIGLLFSTADVVQDVPNSRCRAIEDIERNGFIFTDGCGLASKDFVHLMASKKPIIFRGQRYYPSVLQIRYQGYKGVVCIEPRMEKGLWLKLRKSMKKFSGTDDMSFAVVAFSKPYTYGYLNDEIVLLLNALGIDTDVFTKKQRDYFEFLDQSRTDPTCAFRLLSSLGVTAEAEKLLVEGMEEVQRTVRKTVTQEYGKMLNKHEEQKTRILIPRSRLLFGVCDPYGLLKPGECFLRVTLEEFGTPVTMTGVEVLVSRNPCLHPGDLRKLKAVNRPELSHLTDCVVFSTDGKRPAADLMSGGDLDGDTFFVCWDSELIPQAISEPAEYPGAREAIRFSPITADDLIAYFAGYNNMSLGRVKKVYLGWARALGPRCSQCQELNRLFSQCVDGNRIKIPEKLLDPPDVAPNANPFVLDVLHDAAQQHCSVVKKAATPLNPAEQHTLGHDVQTMGITDRDMVEFVLSNPTPFSDFELAKLTLSWCRRNNVPFEEFWAYFDASQLTVDEQAWILSELPPSPKYPSHFKNGLLQSNILSPEDLRAFRLDLHFLHWKCVFDSQSDPLRRLMAMVNQTFPRFAKKLLILRLGERLSIAIYFPRPIEREEDAVVHETVRLFAFPHSHKDRVGHRRGVPTKKNYRFYYDENMMQLYENHRSNTFVFFARSPNDDSAYRSVRGTSNRARARQKTIEQGVNCDWRVSIALAKFSAQLATHIGRTKDEPVTEAELYVISNKDVRALRALDLWLESVDTLDVLPNFPDEQPPYTLPTLNDVDWSLYSDFVVQVVRQKNYTLVREATATQLADLLKLGWKNDLTDVVSEVYSRILHPETTDEGPSLRCSPEAIQCLAEFLHFNPAMAIHFARLCPWSLLPAPYSSALQREGLAVLRAFILCANKAGELVVKHINAVLQDTSLTLSAARELLEVASIAVASPDLMLTILMECRDAFSHAIQDHDHDVVAYFLQHMFGAVLDHCAEASDQTEATPGSWMLKPGPATNDRVFLVTSQRRIDAPRLARLAVGDHVRFIAKTPAINSSATQPATFDALVEAASDNGVKFRCLSQPATFLEKTAWTMKHCGSIVNTQSAGEALVHLLVEKEQSCSFYHTLLRSKNALTESKEGGEVLPMQHCEFIEGLNESQSRAVDVSIKTQLTCLWGPPGTGKTTTIIALLQTLLKEDKAERILVTAPTHNAVDNVLRQYVKKALNIDPSLPRPVRVSTEVTKVSDDMKTYTIDAMLGKDLNMNPATKRKAVERISGAKLVFTTCVSAALGLLRKQNFDTVVIDEASQQTESASLIPLVKGCQRGILVGDHVQLRATVSPHASTLDYDVSLMERLWGEVSDNTIGRVMLDTQYRMHPSLCAFPSHEFYGGRLLSADGCRTIDIPASSFPWPKRAVNARHEPSPSNRAVFIQCGDAEDLGRKSKVNQTQAKICKEILTLLTTTPASNQSNPGKSPSPPPPPSIAILTPYARQADLLRQLCGGHTVSSIDGFQGQEADVVIFITVRCNVQGEIGFLKDMRRLNVALTRAKAGVIIVGDRATLTMRREQEDACQVWDRLIKTCSRVEPPAAEKKGLGK